MKTELRQRILRKTSHISVVLSLLSLGTVLCFLYPEVLTTPGIRTHYPIELIRKILFGAILLSIVTAGYALLFTRSKVIAFFSLATVLVVQALGGSQVPLKDDFENFTVHVGLDWFVLNLLMTAVVFIPLEALFPKYPHQKIIRPDFRIDLTYFAVGHMGIQLLAFLIQKPADFWLNHLRIDGVKMFVSGLPVLLQVLLALFVADFLQYWIHRAFHAHRKLWQFHKIHHSIKTLDWLAGSRLHLVDIVVVRFLIYFAVMYLGLSQRAFFTYLGVVAFQTVWIHSNMGVRFDFLKYLIVTPRYHHWHHHDRPIAYDKNFAVHFPVIDMIFGTYYMPKSEWPSAYGVEEDQYPRTYVGQLLHPFTRISSRHSNSA